MIFTVTTMSLFNARSIVASKLISCTLSGWRFCWNRCPHKANAALLINFSVFTYISKRKALNEKQKVKISVRKSVGEWSNVECNVRQSSSSVPSRQWYSVQSQRWDNGIHVPSPHLNSSLLHVSSGASVVVPATDHRTTDRVQRLTSMCLLCVCVFVSTWVRKMTIKRKLLSSSFITTPKGST